MTFLHKLAQRLARMRRMIVAVVLLGACEVPLTAPGGSMTRLLVSPKSVTLFPNQTTDLTAVGLTAAGDTAMGISVNWNVTGGTLVDTSTNGGRHYGRYKSGNQLGKYNVVATSGAATDSGVVTVTQVPVATVAVTPAASVAVAQTVQLTATPLDSTGAPLSGRSVTWASSNTVVAAVTGSGLVTGVAAGSATITATSEGKSGTAAVTVTTVPVASVTVSPATASVTVGATVQLTATPKDASGNPLSGRVVTWATSSVSVATVSGSGLVTGVAAGTATITATSEGKSGTAAVTVTTVPVASVTVSPATASVSVGQTVQLTATPKDASGNTLSGRVVTWASSAPAAATVSGSGLVTGVAAGTATITATSETKSATAAITVTATVTAPGTVTTLAVAGVTDTSATLSFTEVNDGTGLPASYDIRYAVGTISWAGTPSVSRGTCATPVAGTTIGARRTCTVLGLAPATAYQFQLVAFRGTLNVNAVFGGLSNVASGTTAASSAPVASVTVSPASASVGVAQTVQLTATPKDASGNPLSGRTIAWVSGNTGVATVNGTGLVTGVAAGSATVTATSEGKSGTAAITVTASGPGQVTYFKTNFTDGTTGPLSVYVYPNGSGNCAKSTDYTDPGSAYSMKCTITAATGSAALEAWFGTNGLASTPKDPTLDQDLFEQVRFVLGPGATASIGGTSCNSLNPNSQFKTHKSVYGEVGSAVNGWAMSEIGPCSDGNIGMFSEAEMWNINGVAYPWPGTFPSLNEGSVYDVVYRYHRYTAQGCGTIAIWVNGAKILDTPCWSYMGTTGGSSAGLLFWDGATYLQSGLGPLTVYNLFSQATNYPVGAGTASP